MQHFSHHWLRHLAVKTAGVQPKKTPATMPASEYCVKPNKPFFEETAALPEKPGVSGENRSDRFVRLLSIKFG
jgi:hypothetical protein